MLYFYCADKKITKEVCQLNDIIHILNLHPRDVKDCSFHFENSMMFYSITLTQDEFVCKDCSSKLKIKDYRKRKISHQLIRGKDTYIIYKARRYFCSTCHKTHFESNPFSNNSHISTLTQIEILKSLKEVNHTFSSVSRTFHIPVTTIVSIFDKYAHMTTLDFPEIMCIDEHYAFRKKETQYISLLVDFKNGTIIDVVNGRTKRHFSSYTQLLSKKEVSKVKFISIDMSTTYKSVQQLYFPTATLCVDSFHVVATINKLLKRIRITIMKKYQRDSINYYLLKTFHWLLMTNGTNIDYNTPRYNRKLKGYYNYNRLLEMILDIDPILRTAYQLKEDYIFFNSTASLDSAHDQLLDIIIKFKNSNIPSFVSFADSLSLWFVEIVNSFTIRNERRISNGIIESINSKIDTLLTAANGYSNFSRLRNRIMFSINKNSPLITYRTKPINIKEPGKIRGTYRKKNKVEI